jgi:hypothetical protein
MYNKNLATICGSSSASRQRREDSMQLPDQQGPKQTSKTTYFSTKDVNYPRFFQLITQALLGYTIP